MSKSGSGYCAISVALLSGIIALLLAGQAAAGIIFQDDFETGDLSKNQAGAHWGASNHGTIDNLRVSNGRAKTGQYSLEFTFHGDANIDADAWSEQRFELGGRYAEIWMKYDIYVPANYNYRMPTTGANNKFMTLWGGAYAGPALGIGWETEALGDGTGYITFHNAFPDQTHRWDPIRYQRTDTRTFGLTDRGTWVEIIVQTKAASVANNDGEARVWKRPQGSSTRTLIFEQTGMNTYNAAGNFFERGYLLGWSDSGYAETTVFYIDNVVISDTPIDVSGGATGGNTPPPSSSSGGDSGGGSGGGSGCGFVKDNNGKWQKAKGEWLSFAMMLIISLAGIALLKKGRGYEKRK